ncbi:MAG TPA: hypothetical protein VGF67_27300 [Ktedonobacteraceae bacterium]|jgi:hypothetical protein
MNKIRKATILLFLRTYRHILFNKAFQEELVSLYQKEEQGQPPVAPAMLAYSGVSDDEVIEAIVCTYEALFSKGMLVPFRKRRSEAQLDRRLSERTIEIASQSPMSGPRALRAALGSSLLWRA